MVTRAAAAIVFFDVIFTEKVEELYECSFTRQL